jgi:delta1-piperideine-2-carboxylate reductase
MTEATDALKHLSLGEVHDLAFNCLAANGCDDANAQAIADNMTAAERDRSESHGLFRLPGYVASLQSGKADGKAVPRIEDTAPGVVRVDAANGFAPLALEVGRKPLVSKARTQGVAALAVHRTFHFAALWPEVEALAREGLVAFACTSTLPFAAPAGGAKPLFGTDPVAFAWPRPDGPPVVFDMATTAMARGEVMIAAREGHDVPLGVGLDGTGQPTRDPKAILDEGVMLPFGGYKGSAISMMVELFAGALIGEVFSFQAGEADNRDGGPSRGGELILAIDPERVSGGGDWRGQGEALFQRMLETGNAPGAVRLPGDRRYANRDKTPRDGIAIPRALYGKIVDLTG